MLAIDLKVSGLEAYYGIIKAVVTAIWDTIEAIRSIAEDWSKFFRNTAGMKAGSAPKVL